VRRSGLPAEKLSESTLKGHQGEKIDPCGGVELGGQIDIAVRPRLAARRRPEQREVPDAGRLQFVGMRAQRRDDRFGGGSRDRHHGASLSFRARPRIRVTSPFPSTATGALLCPPFAKEGAWI
jgi:hypothetical protein